MVKETSDKKVKKTADSLEKVSKDRQEVIREDNDSRHRRRPMLAALRIMLSIIILALMSVFLAWYLCWQTNMKDTTVTDEFISEKLNLFWYNVAVIFFILASLAAILWRPCFSIGVGFSLISVLGYINEQKMLSRDAPLMPEDFQMIDAMGNMTQFVDSNDIVRLVFGVIFVLIGSWLLDQYLRKIFGYGLIDKDQRKKIPWWEKIKLVPRLTLGSIALAGLVLVADPVVHQRKSDLLPEVEYVAWNQTENYEDNGFLIGFLYNLGKQAVSEPENYTEERIAEISEKYRKIKGADVARKPLDKVAKNIVLVLDETFYDPELLSKYYAHEGGDVIPNLRKVFAKYPSGYMYSPEYGGGTANVEFEVQTGLSNFWAQNYPYVNYLPKGENILAAAAWAKDFGFDTTAIHAYYGSMYKRNLVYPKLGYNTFIDMEQFKYTDREFDSEYINDRSTFREVLDVLKQDDKAHFVAAVTMQNHMPYLGPNYPEFDFKLETEGHADIESSFQSIHSNDQYIAEFLTELDQLEEPTVVLWFGDHAAGILADYAGSEEKAERDLAHLTPYFIYANFEIKSPYTISEVAAESAVLGFDLDTKNVDLPITTPNCLFNTVYNILQVEKPILGYVLDQVCMETPILSASYFANTKPEETTALKEYELINYDVLNGKHYWTGY